MDDSDNDTKPVLVISGYAPQQTNLSKKFDADDMLLFTASKHGMKTGDKAHRLELFAFVQSHISNKSDENLQRCIESSPYWQKFDKGSKTGFYNLNDAGYQKILRKFGEGKDSERLNLGCVYQFIRAYKGYVFAVVVNPLSRSKKLTLIIDDTEMSGSDAYSFLESIGAKCYTKSRSNTTRLLNWILQDNIYSWKRYEVNQDSGGTSLILNMSIADNEEMSFPEGKEVYRIHRAKERNQQVIRIAKRHGLQRDPFLCCQICGFSFIKVYGNLGEGFIEAHHTAPLSTLEESTETKVEDIALVCSNCHRMLHRRRPWLSNDELSKLLKTK
jgi:hypothetical protein